MELKTSETLNKAAELIEERGWTTGSGWQLTDFDTESASICLEGALQLAMSLPAVPERLAADLCDEINLCPAGRALHVYLTDLDSSWLFMWNDRQTSAGPVVEVLRACAVIEAAKEDGSALALLDVPVAGVASVRVAAGEAS